LKETREEIITLKGGGVREKLRREGDQRRKDVGGASLPLALYPTSVGRGLVTSFPGQAQ
jgi:hypothetical protein